MMSKKQWLLVLCLFIVYLMLGAAIFLQVEGEEEKLRYKEDKELRRKIEALLRSHYDGNSHEVKQIFKNLTRYCGKPINYNMSNDDPPPKWDFYHSLFFVFTVVSTIGYGNLVPTTSLTRIFMIFYGLIGIPMNGIIMVTLGEYFGKSFKKLYVRWKNTRIKRSAAKLGLIGQIILYAVPGMTFFIFLPSTIISVFERWDYDVALYYAFVTLTTIGFGDFVAGNDNDASSGFSSLVRSLYQIFLLVWIIGGLGYVVMVIGFITQGMRSRKLIEMERMLAENIMKSPQRIRNELRGLLHELLFTRVKPVYKTDFKYVPQALERSQSCPDLLISLSGSGSTTPTTDFTLLRKRAMSTCYPVSSDHLKVKMQSETELEKIDKEMTFRPSDAFMQQKDLILKVVDALGGGTVAAAAAAQQRSKDTTSGGGGVHLFSDLSILSTERPPRNRRAASDTVPPKLPSLYTKQGLGGGFTWYGNDANKAVTELRKQRGAVSRTRAFSLAVAKMEKPGLLKRIKNRFTVSAVKEDQLSSIDIEKQGLEGNQQYKNAIMGLQPDSGGASLTSTATLGELQTQSGPASVGLTTVTDSILEQTSIADFIRALSAIAVPEEAAAYLAGKNEQPKRKMGIQRTPAFGRPDLHYQRRPSMIPFSMSAARMTSQRRCSLMPVEEHLLTSHEQSISATPPMPAGRARRRFSVRPAPIQLGVGKAGGATPTPPLLPPRATAVSAPTSLSSTLNVATAATDKTVEKGLTSANVPPVTNTQARTTSPPDESPRYSLQPRQLP